MTEREVDTVSICECEMIPFYSLNLCEGDKLTVDYEMVHRVHRPRLVELNMQPSVSRVHRPHRCQVQESTLQSV